MSSTSTSTTTKSPSSTSPPRSHHSSPSLTSRLLGHIRGLTLLTPWLLWLLISDLLLSLLLPLSPFLPTTTYNLSSRIASTVWTWIQRIFTQHNHASPLIHLPTPLPEGESAIVIANHVSWCDFYLIQELAQRAGMLGRCRWFAKRSLRWVPFLGWGLWAMGMPLVSRRWATDRRELERVFGGVVKHKLPIWLISYSEGTRFTPAKHSLALTHCRPRSLPLPKHTLWPRTRGFISTVQTLRRTSHVRAVYDITLAYSHDGKWFQAPNFWESVAPPVMGVGLGADLRKLGYRFYAKLERFEISELPETDEELGKWLEGRWVEKDRHLEEVKEMWEREVD